MIPKQAVRAFDAATSQAPHQYGDLSPDFLRACLPAELETFRFARLHKHHARIFAENLTQILFRR
jgi:hypothetical protein